ncbi:odorant receptor 13a-like isoform X1 [Apis cerana]|uniref:odorant receptor 13a-like isoform X1 n=1 Tax=Apis cerana TaxID=7461 RepID=UPI002B225FCA|nr:odorant receptor 13a-like isoform X1 [Apis cerana]
MDFAMGWNRFNLTLLGVYPEPRKMSRNSRLMSSLIFWFTTLVTFTFICAPQTANLILKSTSLDEVIENLSINIPIVFALIKQIVLRYYKKALTQLLGEMLADWSEPIDEQDRETMLRNARISRTISIVCSTLTYFMLFAFVSLQIWSNAENASEADLGGLLHPATFPYETSKSPNYEITWLGQLTGTVLTAICYSCFDTFLAVLVLHLCGQLTVLGTALEDLVNATSRNDYKTFEERLGSIVNRHNHLSRFAVIVEDCFNITLLVQTLICTAMFCLTGYRMITSVDREEADVPIVGIIFFIIHVIYTMLHLFIYCYVGETLLGESTGIGQSTYHCNWYDLPSRRAVLLMIVIRRANVSFQITAGKFSPFSLEFFNAVSGKNGFFENFKSSISIRFNSVRY